MKHTYRITKEFLIRECGFVGEIKIINNPILKVNGVVAKTMIKKWKNKKEFLKDELFSRADILFMEEYSFDSYSRIMVGDLEHSLEHSIEYGNYVEGTTVRTYKDYNDKCEIVGRFYMFENQLNEEYVPLHLRTSGD